MAHPLSGVEAFAIAHPLAVVAGLAGGAAGAWVTDSVVSRGQPW